MEMEKKKASSLLDKLLTQFDEYRMKQISRAWCLVSLDERRHRLRVVMNLSVELTKIKQTSGFATRLGENAIEAVIEGDWKHVAEYAAMFAWDEDLGVKKNYGPLWEPFALILRTACAEDARVRIGEKQQPS